MAGASWVVLRVPICSVHYFHPELKWIESVYDIDQCVTWVDHARQLQAKVNPPCYAHHPQCVCLKYNACVKTRKRDSTTCVFPLPTCHYPYFLPPCSIHLIELVVGRVIPNVKGALLSLPYKGVSLLVINAH